MTDDLAADGDRLERERQRAREWIAEQFCDPDDGTPDFNAADEFIGRLDRYGYDIVPNWRRDDV